MNQRARMSKSRQKSLRGTVLETRDMDRRADELTKQKARIIDSIADGLIPRGDPAIANKIREINDELLLLSAWLLKVENTKPAMAKSLHAPRSSGLPLSVTLLSGNNGLDNGDEKLPHVANHVRQLGRCIAHLGRLEEALPLRGLRWCGGKPVTEAGRRGFQLGSTAIEGRADRIGQQPLLKHEPLRQYPHVIRVTGVCQTFSIRPPFRTTRLRYTDRDSRYRKRSTA